MLFTHHRLLAKNPALAIAAACMSLASCDGTVQLCGEYACVYYQSDCQAANNCNQPRQCESAGSIRDRVPRIINELREAQRRCASNAIANPANTNPTTISWDAALAGVSESHARDMAENNFVSFVGSNGLSTNTRVSQAGIDATVVAESISKGPQTSAEAINYWLDIETDCKQLVSTETTRIGMACSVADQPDEGPFWSLLLAGPEQ